MEIQTLKTFNAVVEEGGILSAARKLNTVQSNVTARIKRLESETGTVLFYRKGRGLELSPSGQVLLNYAREILQMETRASLAMQHIGEQAGELRIGSMETYAALRLPAVLAQLHQRYKQLQLHILTNTSSELIRRVLDYKLDCAFVGGPVEHPDLLVTPIVTEELVLLRAKNIKQDANLPLILFKEGCVYRARALEWQRRNGSQFKQVMEFGTLDGILGCVSAGLGCTLMPSWALDNSRYNHELVAQKIDADLAMTPTLLVQHINAIPLKTLQDLAELAAEPAHVA